MISLLTSKRMDPSLLTKNSSCLPCKHPPRYPRRKQVDETDENWNPISPFLQLCEGCPDCYHSIVAALVFFPVVPILAKGKLYRQLQIRLQRQAASGGDLIRLKEGAVHHTAWASPALCGGGLAASLTWGAPTYRFGASAWKLLSAISVARPWKASSVEYCFDWEFVRNMVMLARNRNTS